MKSFSKNLIILLLFFLAACNGSSHSQDENKDEIKSSEVQDASLNEEPTNTSQVEPLKDPCKLLSSSDLKSINGFEESGEGILHKASGDTYKQCDFTINKNIGLGIVFRRLNQKEIDAKRLEKNFDFYLNQENYIEVDNTPGDQAIYSNTKSETPSGVSYSYLLQIRYGNHTESNLGITYREDEQNPEEVLEKLIQIASKMEK